MKKARVDRTQALSLITDLRPYLPLLSPRAKMLAT